MTSTPTTPTTITDWIDEGYEWGPKLRRAVESHEEGLVSALHEMKQLIDSTLDAYAVGGKVAWEATSRLIDSFGGADRVTPVAAKIGRNAYGIVRFAALVEKRGDK
jgi:hypothetical protein